MKAKIKDFPSYEADSDGFVLIKETNQIKTKRLIRGYYYVDLNHRGSRRNLRLGRLIANCFLDNPENKAQVNHIDGDCLNDKLSNLEWCTVSENQIHKNRLARDRGTYKKPKGKRKFSDKEILKVKSLREKGLLHKDIANKLGMGVSTVTHILLGSRRG